MQSVALHCHYHYYCYLLLNRCQVVVSPFELIIEQTNLLEGRVG